MHFFQDIFIAGSAKNISKKRMSEFTVVLQCHAKHVHARDTETYTLIVGCVIVSSYLKSDRNMRVQY